MSRTFDGGVKVPCLTAWRWRIVQDIIPYSLFFHKGKAPLFMEINFPNKGFPRKGPMRAQADSRDWRNPLSQNLTVLPAPPRGELFAIFRSAQIKLPLSGELASSKAR